MTEMQTELAQFDQASRTAPKLSSAEKRLLEFLLDVAPRGHWVRASLATIEQRTGLVGASISSARTRLSLRGIIYFLPGSAELRRAGAYRVTPQSNEGTQHNENTDGTTHTKAAA